MKNLISFLFILCLTLSASAQKVYFMYLQTDNGNPFYIKMSDKIYSSSSAGYIILPNLVDSTYYFSIGFPSSPSESKFSVPINGKDRGFLVKNFGTGWGLFDLQALTIINEQKDQTSDNIQYQKRDDYFASLLSKAANDTSLLYAVVRVKQETPKNDVVETKPKTEEPKVTINEPVTIKDTAATIPVQSTTIINTPSVDSTLIVAKKPEEQKEIKDTATNSIVADTVAVKTENPPIKLEETKTEEKATTQSETAVFKRSAVKKHSESSTSEGFGLVFYDSDESGTDTIRLIIPNPKFTFKEPQPDTTQSDVLLKREEVKTESIKTDTVIQNPIVVAPTTKQSVQSNCKSIASDNDFFKLRRNMASKETDDGMVDEAKKVFKGKCFTTEQIKNLSALFLTSAGKYQFFDAAYLHVSDQEKFSSLQSEIKDDYYLKRFKALVGE